MRKSRFSEEQIISHILKQFADKKIILLAPLVKGRKGHYRELFEQVRKQGYLKVRVDGDIVDIKERMQVDRYKIHDIEAVIDRIKVAPEEEQRVRNSVATALKMGKDLLMVLDYDTDEVFNFSKKLMDASTGISYEEPSPNSFSFNSPYGACPHCNGLGTVHEISEVTLIPDPSLPISQGGISPLGEIRDNFIFKQMRTIAKRYGFSLSTPVGNIPEEALNLILYGTTVKIETPVDLEDTDRWYSLEFGGVAGMLRRCYHGSSSDALRRWAEDFMEIGASGAVFGKIAGVTGSRAHTRTDHTSRPLAPSISTASAFVYRYAAAFHPRASRP